MTQVYIICEGRTESTVVKNVIAPELGTKGIFLYPIQIGRRRKGGNVALDRLLPTIRAQLYNNRTAYCTSLIDYYGLPSDFPGKRLASRKHVLSEKSETICGELVEQLGHTIDCEPLRRFIPYVQMHEFEGLLFSDPNRLAIELGREDRSECLSRIRNEFETPEHIDDSPLTAPSKRIQELVPRYRKVQMGERVAKALTLEKIRYECPLFDNWLTQLENLQPLPA